MSAKRWDQRSPLEQALDAASGLKPGSWASVEALSMLAIEAHAVPKQKHCTRLPSTPFRI